MEICCLALISSVERFWVIETDWQINYEYTNAYMLENQHGSPSPGKSNIWKEFS